jgi:hypothetical protein
MQQILSCFPLGIAPTRVPAQLRACPSLAFTAAYD